MGGSSRAEVGLFAFGGVFGVLGNATKSQLYRFTGLNRQLTTMAPIAKLKPQVDGSLFLENAGYGWFASFWPRNPAWF